MRARFRAKVRAMEMTNTVHGVRRGHHLSSRFMVDSRISLMAGKMPKRAYYQRGAKFEVSMAAAVVLDQSSSMDGSLTDVTRVMCALAEPLDAIGCALQVSGFRNGKRGQYNGYHDKPEGEPDTYHRYDGIINDVFMAFGERWRSVKWRFANTRATGGTPMADGMQFGLDALDNRPEGHRFMFVITDGQPAGGHIPIMRRQQRLARDAGIHIVGVNSFHDDATGSERGANVIFILTIDDVRVCHLGDLGHVLTEGNVRGMGTVDVLMVPVGGTYTIDSSQADKVVNMVKPRIIIPMHYKTDKCGFPIDGAGPFLAEKENVIQRPSEVTITKVESSRPRSSRSEISAA